MKAIHYIILFAAAGLIYLLFFSKCKQSGGRGGGDNIEKAKEEIIAFLSKEACNVEKQLKEKYGENPPPVIATDPLTLKLRAIFGRLKDAGVKSLPTC
jgi:hypothetical protein